MKDVDIFQALSTDSRLAYHQQPLSREPAKQTRILQLTCRAIWVSFQSLHFTAFLHSLYNSLTASATRVLACSNLQPPHISGTEILSFSAQHYTNYVTSHAMLLLVTALVGFTTANISYCNVTIAYTHTKQNDSINLQVWLPDEWMAVF